MQEMWVDIGELGMVNATALPLKNGKFAVIDTGGTPGDGESFAKRVAEMGEVAFVFCTHEHGDHLQGNRFFHCPIISSVPAKHAIQQMLDAGVPNVVFSERLELDIGEPLIMQLMGGHCPGVSVLYLPERKLLFTGDLIFNGRMPWMGQADFQLWVDNLDQLLSWDVDTVVPGHGPVGGKEIIAAQKQFLISFLDDVRQAAKTGQTEEQIFQMLSVKHAVREQWQPMVQRAVQLALQA